MEPSWTGPRIEGCLPRDEASEPYPDESAQQIYAVGQTETTYPKKKGCAASSLGLKWLRGHGGYIGPRGPEEPDIRVASLFTTSSSWYKLMAQHRAVLRHLRPPFNSLRYTSHSCRARPTLQDAFKNRQSRLSSGSSAISSCHDLSLFCLALRSPGGGKK